jgi:uncharacterized protein (TIGR02271 family)
MPSASHDDELRLPLSAELLDVTRQQVVTGRVRVSTVTRERKEAINELLTSEHAEVERVSLGKLIDEIPSIRQEGDTIVIPVVEEVLVFEKKLILKEEVRVRRVRHVERRCEEVTLREQDAVITRSTVNQTEEQHGSNHTKPEEEGAHG